MVNIINFGILSFLIFIFTTVEAVVTPNPSAPTVAAKSYILQDFESGQVIAELNPDYLLPPASITKLMTAYVVLQELKMGNIGLADEVLISEKAWRMVGSRSFIEVNTKVPVEALLRGMITQSGNDSAVALAEHIAGSEETFTRMMNQYADNLGMVNTNYHNSTGLPDPNHYTTARNISTLSSAIIRDFPDYYKWYSEKKFTYNNIVQYNRNKLLWRDKSVDGLKTGHTEEAGYCLAASAKRGDMRLISVVLGTRSENARAQEAQKLMNYGFRFFETHALYRTYERITSTKIWKGDDNGLDLGLQRTLSVTVPRGRYKELIVNLNIKNPIIAPIMQGWQLGVIKIYLGDNLITQRPLIALQDIENGSWWRCLIDAFLMIIWD
ncbi:MAG: D-alanyl-D-alanine carboxypeptidase [Piscirickettsiaceae bacterium]|nr:D-alanyl-D-alanine carboxypeptidase [Piscirickettsiaceae bacterium]